MNILINLIVVAVVGVSLWFAFDRVKNSLNTAKSMIGDLTKIGGSEAAIVGAEEVEATILESQETGVYINNLPVIDLQIEYVTLAGQHLTTKLRTPASLLALSKFAPGSKITIAYDPAKPEHVMLPRPEQKRAAS